jgi:hypothetical protein
VHKLSELLPFLTLGALGVVNLVAAVGALRARAGPKSSEKGALIEAPKRSPWTNLLKSNNH